MAKRYAVLDKDGVVVNHILIDDPLPKGYWPGYGATLVPLEPVSTSKGGAGLDVLVFDKLDSIPQIGDTIDLATGAITKFVPQLVDQVDDKGQVVLDGQSQPIKVASAPVVSMTKDAQPKPTGGTVTPKTGPAGGKVLK